MMDYPIHVDRISMQLSILFYRVACQNVYKFIFFVPKDSFYLSKADLYVTFHLGFHWLPMYLFTGIRMYSVK